MSDPIVIAAVVIAIALAVLLVVAAIADRRRARNIELDPQRPGSQQALSRRWFRARNR